MSTMYALPALSTWFASSGAGSWSNTSGGASNGSFPNGGTDVVFDANSGPARAITISGGFTVQTLMMAAANSMTFSGDALTVTGPLANLGSSTGMGLSLAYSAGTSLACTGSLSSLSSHGTGTVSLTSSLVVAGAVVFYPGGFNLAGYDLSCASLSVTYDPEGYSEPLLSMGSGTTTITGGGFGVNATLSGTGTLKFTNSSGTAATYTADGSGSFGGTLWVATTGAGGLRLNQLLGLSILKMSPGAKLDLNYHTLQADYAYLDGTAAPITLSGPGTLTKAAGGTVDVDHCVISGVTATPAATWRARASTDGGGNSGWTFVPGSSDFFQFF